MEKSQASARGNYLATALLRSLDRRCYSKLVLSLKNFYAKQQKNYPKTLIDMYGLMVVFEPTRPTAVYGGRNEGINFGNVTVEPETGGSGIMVAAAEQSERLSVGAVGGVPYEKGRSETCRGQIKQEKG